MMRNRCLYFGSDYWPFYKSQLPAVNVERDGSEVLLLLVTT